MFVFYLVLSVFSTDRRLTILRLDARLQLQLGLCHAPLTRWVQLSLLTNRIAYELGEQ